MQIQRWSRYNLSTHSTKRVIVIALIPGGSNLGNTPSNTGSQSSPENQTPESRAIPRENAPSRDAITGDLPDPAIIARARQAAMQTLPGQSPVEQPIAQAPASEYSHPSDAPIPHQIKGVSRAQWSKVKLLALDVDGVLTDGGLTFDEDGQLLQTFHVRDGFALVAARRAGLVIAWISGRASRVAEKRFQELDLHHCILACADKSVALTELQNQYGFTPEDCCFVGDDLPDLPAFARSGVRVAVADAVEEVKSRANYVTQANGGRGAVREVIELILSAQGHWDALMSRFTCVDEAQGSVENYQR